MTRKVLTVVAASTIAIGGALGATAIIVGADEDKPEMKKVALPVAVEQFDPAVANAFSVAERPRQAIPASQVAITSRAKGADPDAAREARRSPNGGTVSILPTSDGLCIASTSGVESDCYEAPQTVTVTAVICAPGLPPDEVEVFGIAPDGIDSVSVSREDGSSSTAAVQGNIYIYRAAKDLPRPVSVSWKGASGERGSISAGVPADFRDDRCATPPSPAG